MVNFRRNSPAEDEGDSTLKEPKSWGRRNFKTSKGIRLNLMEISIELLGRISAKAFLGAS